MSIKSESYSFLDVEIRDNIAFATMTHPDYSHEEREEWPRLIADVAADSDVHVLLITGWGNPKRGRKPGAYEDFDAFKYYDRAAHQPVPALQDLDKPVVMAIDGDPGLLTIPLSGDILVAERHLQFSDHHVLIGVASATQPYLMPLNSGLLRAKRYILTGDFFSAEEAEAMGVVTEVVDTGQSRARATEYAQHLASLRPETLQATKRALNQWMRLVRTPVYEHGLALEFMLFPKDYAEQHKERTP